MAVTTLYPFAQATSEVVFFPSDTDKVYDAPTLVGGGSVSDDSVTSYAQLGAYVDGSDNKHIEALAADFSLTSGTPFALVLQVQLASDADVLGDPVDPLLALADCPVQLTDTSNTPVVGSSVNLRWTAVKGGTVSAPTWYTWAFLGEIETNDPVDLDNPSDDGGWLTFAPDSDIATALRGDGLRFAFGAYWPADTANTRRAWIDLMEMRLIVATTSGYHPLRRFPRSDGLGVGPRRHYPLPSTGQRSLRRVGGTY